MRFGNQANLGGSQLVRLKGDDWLPRQQHAGNVVAECLKFCKQKIEEGPGVSLKELEEGCEDIMRYEKCVPTFKDYKGFPGAICTSVNKHLVHGVPTDYRLKEGDVVSVDMGATFEGAIADAALTAICGKPKNFQHERLLQYCQGALHKAIEAIEIGKPLGVIGAAIHKHVKSSGFKLITKYGGHGIHYDTPHDQPFVANKSRREDGIIIQPGLAIAIEPMLVMGFSDKTRTLNDKWTVTAKDIGCHFEHSVFVGEDKVHVITHWEQS